MQAASSKATLYSCNERQTVPVPPSKFIGPDGTVRVFKESLSRGYFDIDFRSGEVVLVAGRYVGLIPVNENVVVEILPKTRLTDFARILEIAGEDPGALRFFERTYLETQGIDRFFPLIAKSLVQQLRSVAQEGLMKSYCRKDGIHTFKPRIQFSKTAQRLWARGNFSHSYSEVFEFTKDTAFNRLIKYAIWFCGRYFGSRPNKEGLAAEIEFYANLFEVVPLDLKLSFIAEVQDALRLGRIPTLRQYYVGISKAALLIARNSSVTLDPQNADVQLLSFIINLEEVYEKYVRNSLRAFAKMNRQDLVVQNGNLEGRGYLFHDSIAAEIKPDIIIAHGEHRPLVVDVKYKPRTTDADRYQLISHAAALGAGIAVSVLPASDGLSGLARKGQIYNGEGIEIFEYHMPLEGNLADEEKLMATEILNLVPAL